MSLNSEFFNFENDLGNPGLPGLRREEGSQKRLNQVVCQKTKI